MTNETDPDEPRDAPSRAQGPTRPSAKGVVLSALAGVVLGGAAALGGMLATGFNARVNCPDGWTPGPDHATPLGHSMMTCGAAEEGLGDAKLHLLWRSSGALDDASLVAVAHAAGLGGALRPAPLHEAGVEGASLTADHEGDALKSDVYFLSAGQRYGMLSIVYGPAAEFAREATVASWLETIEGTAPWGSPVTPTLRAQCPRGFTALRAETPGMVLRCMRGVGTRAFTVLQLTQGEGGFGTETDRTRLARDVARRVAGPAGNARVLEDPRPFTLARNVDALRASFQTEERLTLATRVAWARTPSSGNVVALYVGPDTPSAEAALRAFVRPVRASRISGTLLGVLGFALFAAALGVGFAVSRRAAGRPLTPGST